MSDYTPHAASQPISQSSETGHNVVTQGSGNRTYVGCVFTGAQTISSGLHVLLNSTFSSISSYDRDVAFYLKSKFQDFTGSSIYIDRADISYKDAAGYDFSTWGPVISTLRKSSEACDIFLTLDVVWHGPLPFPKSKPLSLMELEWAVSHADRSIGFFKPDGETLTQELALHSQELVADPESLFHKARRSYPERQFENFPFESKDELCRKVTQFCLGAVGITPINAAKKQVALVAQEGPSDEKFGLLGRDQQLTAVNKIFKRISSKTPLVGLFVTGHKKAGQRPFIQQMLLADPLQQDWPLTAKEIETQPPAGSYADRTTIMQWVARILGFEAPATLTDLAQNILSELQTQQLCVILDDIEALKGGVELFYKDFWEPFFHDMQRLRTAQHTYRLVFVLVDYSGQPFGEREDLKAYDENRWWDGQHLIMLPPLTNITPDILKIWFNDSSPDVPESEWDRLIKLALTNPMTGELEAEAIPADVFERLSHEAILMD
jgi:hypothetical protein